MEIKPIQIIYAPGTFGNTLRWLLDRFTQGSKFKNVDSPWDENGRAHSFNINDFNPRFIRGHQVAGRDDSPDPRADKVVLNFDVNDLAFIERCGFYRNPGMETEDNRYKQIIESADQTFVANTYTTTTSKLVAKELMKIQFHDMQNQNWWQSMNNFLQDKHHQFNMYALWDNNMLIEEIERVSTSFNLDLMIESNVIENVVQKIKSTHVVKTKDRAVQALDAIMDGSDVPCGDFDIIEQAFVETELEKTHDSVLFPYGTNWFSDTNQIRDFLKTYPTYLKHMNPRLPWYNNIKNPFYLKGRIDKSK